MKLRFYEESPSPEYRHVKRVLAYAGGSRRCLPKLIKPCPSPVAAGASIPRSLICYTKASSFLVSVRTKPS